MNVLSLFDGCRMAYIALERAGIKVNKYYASEIDKYAIQIGDKHYPDTINLGDITNWQKWNIDWSSIDLVIGGSPCQGFSVAGKRLSFKDHRSKLLFEYIKIRDNVLKHNPKAQWLLENVNIQKKILPAFNNYVGKENTYINSNLLSAQNRKRFYWSSLDNIEIPEDKGLLLRDIVHEIVDCDMDYIPNFNVNPSGRGMNGIVRCVVSDKSTALTTNKGEGSKISIPLQKYIVDFDDSLILLNKDVENGKLGFFRKDSQANRIYFTNNKSVTLLGEAGGGAAKMGQYFFGTYTKNYVQYDLSDKNHKSQDQRAFYLDSKHGTLPAKGASSKCKVLIPFDKYFYSITGDSGETGILIEGYIRRLTPIECERLQTLPEGYTESVSNAQRYKMIGNGFTVDVIAHILRQIKKQ